MTRRSRLVILSEAKKLVPLKPTAPMSKAPSVNAEDVPV